MAERVLERVAERMRRTPAWGEVDRGDLVGPGATDRRQLSSEEGDFFDAWGRPALRDDDADEQAEYPGLRGVV